VTALAYRTAIEHPARFAKAQLVGAHLGLTPRRYASRDGSEWWPNQMRRSEGRMLVSEPPPPAERKVFV
jgi:hypothetical protein